MGDIQYPGKGESVCIIYRNSNGEEAMVMTEKEMHTSFSLWERRGNKWERLGRGKTPTDLEVEYDVLKRLQVPRK